MQDTMIPAPLDTDGLDKATPDGEVTDRRPGNEALRELRRIRELLEARDAELLDADATAKMLGFSKPTLHRLKAAGRCPAPVRIGSIVRWRRADLQQFIKDLTPGR